MPAPKQSQLVQDQQIFMRCIGELLTYVRVTDWNKLYGYKSVQVRTGDFYRPDKKGHMKDSRHYERCAGDIILDVDGVYVTDSFHPVYVAMGRYWESLNVMCRWGGRFRKVDGNHFSIGSADGLRA